MSSERPSPPRRRGFLGSETCPLECPPPRRRWTLGKPLRGFLLELRGNTRTWAGRTRQMPRSWIVDYEPLNRRVSGEPRDSDCSGRRSAPSRGRSSERPLTNARLAEAKPRSGFAMEPDLSAAQRRHRVLDGHRAVGARRRINLICQQRIPWVKDSRFFRSCVTKKCGPAPRGSSRNDNMLSLADGQGARVRAIFACGHAAACSERADPDVAEADWAVVAAQPEWAF